MKRADRLLLSLKVLIQEPSSIQGLWEARLSEA